MIFGIEDAYNQGGCKICKTLLKVGLPKMSLPRLMALLDIVNNYCIYGYLKALKKALLSRYHKKQSLLSKG